MNFFDLDEHVKEGEDKRFEHQNQDNHQQSNEPPSSPQIMRPSSPCTSVISSVTNASMAYPPSTFVVRPRDYYLYYLCGRSAGDLIKWSFWTKKKNIAFGLYYLVQNSDSSQKLDEIRDTFRNQAGGLNIWPPPKGQPASNINEPMNLSRSNSVIQRTTASRDNGSVTTALSLSEASLGSNSNLHLPLGSTNEDQVQPESLDHSDFLTATTAFAQMRKYQYSFDYTGEYPGTTFDFIEILPIERYESFENTIVGSYRAPVGGIYILCFDNSFSINTSKAVSLTLKVVPFNQQKMTSQSSLEPELENDLDMEDSQTLISSWMLKKKRKRIQGWAKRWVQLDRNGVLSYSEYRGTEPRGSVEIRKCAVSRVPQRNLITVDSEEVTFHFRALNEDDFMAWSLALNSFFPDAPGHHLHLHNTDKSIETLQKLDIESSLNVLPFNDEMKSKIFGMEADIDMRMQELTRSLAQLKEAAAAEADIVAKYLNPMERSFGSLEELYKKVREYSTVLRELHAHNLMVVETSQKLGEFAGTTLEEPEDIFYDIILSDVSESEYTDAEEFESEHDLSSIYEACSEISDASVCKAAVVTAGFRTKLPAPAPPCNISLASILRKSIGKDSSNMVMPMALNEPLNGLQRLCEELEYVDLLDKAAAEQDSLERLVYVACFAVSAYANSISRADRKPFNPMLGETYEYVDDGRSIKFVSEKVSHRPLILACHAQGRGWNWWQEQTVKTKFWGKSMEFIPSGYIHASFDNGDHFRWTKVVSCLRNVLAGKKWVENYGDMKIVNLKTGDAASVTFKASGGFFGSSLSTNEVMCTIESHDRRRIIKMTGRWDSMMMREYPNDDKLEVLWRANTLPHHHQDYYGFTNFAFALNQMFPHFEDILPPSDTRRRPDQRLLEEGKVEEAEAEMMRLVERQREVRSKMEAGGETWKPRWFQHGAKDHGGEWTFTGQYWEARTRKEWNDVPTLW